MKQFCHFDQREKSLVKGSEEISAPDAERANRFSTEMIKSLYSIFKSPFYPIQGLESTLRLPFLQIGLESTQRLAFQGQAGPASSTPLCIFLAQSLRTAIEIYKVAFEEADTN